MIFTKAVFTALLSRVGKENKANSREDVSRDSHLMFKYLRNKVALLIKNEN